VLGVARDGANAMRPGVDWISVAPRLAAASPRLEVRNIYHLIKDRLITETLRFSQEEDLVDLEDHLALLSLR
jgi:hypothetical protein